MSVKYYVDNGGNYMGAFEGATGIDTSSWTEVPTAPAFALDIWNGNSWDSTSEPADSVYGTGYVAEVIGGTTSGHIAIWGDVSGETIIDGGANLVIPGTLSSISIGKTGGVQYILPATDGTPGQSLKTDGSGNLYWG